MSKENADLEKILNISLKANKKAEKNMTKQLKRIDQIKQTEEIKGYKNLFNKQVSSAKRVSKEVEKFNKMINDNLDMSSEKSEIINRLIELHSLRRLYYLNNADNNSKANEKIDDV